MITGYVSLDNAMRCMNYGADNCIFKPLDDLEELENSVHQSVAHIATWTRKLRELQGMKPAR